MHVSVLYTRTMPIATGMANHVFFIGLSQLARIYIT